MKKIQYFLFDLHTRYFTSFDIIFYRSKINRLYPFRIIRRIFQSFFFEKFERRSIVRRSRGFFSLSLFFSFNKIVNTLSSYTFFIANIKLKHRVE